MKNKKGFTLIEVSISITLILLLALLVVPNIINMSDNSKEKMFNTKIELALTGAYKYGKDNIDDLNNNCKEVTIGYLIEEGYISGDDETSLINPITNESMNDTIICVYYDKEVKVSIK